MSTTIGIDAQTLCERRVRHVATVTPQEAVSDCGYNWVRRHVRRSALHIPLLPGRPREPRGEWQQLVGQVCHECTLVGLMNLVAQLVLPLLLAPSAAAVFGIACSPSRVPVPPARTRGALSWPVWRMVSAQGALSWLDPFGFQVGVMEAAESCANSTEPTPRLADTVSGSSVGNFFAKAATRQS